MIGDHRNYLYKYYGKFLERYSPKVFLFENVPGFYTANNGKFYKRMMDYFKGIGYKVNDKILDASEFGVLQRRKRIIVIGWKNELDFSYPTFNKVESEWKIEDLLFDLPSISAGTFKEITNNEKSANEYLNKFEIRNGLDFITQHIARPHNDEDLKIYKWLLKNLRTKGKG